MTSLHDGVTAC